MSKLGITCIFQPFITFNDSSEGTTLFWHQGV